MIYIYIHIRSMD